MDIESLKDNKYIKKIGTINVEKEFAEKIEVLKHTHMQAIEPAYPLGGHFRAKSEAPGEDSTHSTNFGSSMALLRTIKKTEDVRSLFSDYQLSTLTLEQKMLAGLFVPRKRRDPNAIELI